MTIWSDERIDEEVEALAYLDSPTKVADLMKWMRNRMLDELAEKDEKISELNAEVQKLKHDNGYYKESYRDLQKINNMQSNRIAELAAQLNDLIDQYTEDMQRFAEQEVHSVNY